MVTPPNVTGAQWASALAAFKSAVGEKWVFTSDEDVALYRDPYSPLWGESEERLISAAVAPQSVEEVQAVVRAANQYGIPLYPISTGKNLGYGGAAPNLSGSVVLDLKRMNRIIEVDERRHFAIVEPGVSYFDLHHHIRERNLRVWIDCPDPGWGSVVGNALDHGVGYTWGAYRDHFWSHCGLEVVLPNGELMRTGMGAMPAAKTFADFRYGFGPYVDGLFSQAGFGVVTKMGVHLMPQPEAFLQTYVHVPRRRHIVPLVEIANELENGGMIGVPHIDTPMFFEQFKDPALMAIAQSPDVWDGTAIDRYAAEKGVPAWRLALRFYGPPSINEAKWQYAKARIAKEIPEARFIDDESLRFPLSPDEQERVVNKAEAGIPSLSVFVVTARSRNNPNATDGHAFFSPIIPRDGEELMKAQRIFAEGAAAAGAQHTGAFGPFTQAFAFHPRTFMLAGVFPVSRSDPEVNKLALTTIRKLIVLGAEHGYGEYRTSPVFQDQVMSTYSFNNNALRRFCETLKDAVDPKGVISPGRGGFWPRALRKDA